MKKYEVVHVITGEKFIIEALNKIEAYGKVCGIFLDRYGKERGIDLSRTAYHMDLNIKEI